MPINKVSFPDLSFIHKRNNHFSSGILFNNLQRRWTKVMKFNDMAGYILLVAEYHRIQMKYQRKPIIPGTLGGPRIGLLAHHQISFYG